MRSIHFTENKYFYSKVFVSALRNIGGSNGDNSSCCFGSLLCMSLVHQVRKVKMKDLICTAQTMRFSVKDFFSKCDEIRRKLWICSHLLKKSLMENFIFCAVIYALTRFAIWVFAKSPFHHCLLYPSCYKLFKGNHV